MQAIPILIMRDVSKSGHCTRCGNARANVIAALELSASARRSTVGSDKTLDFISNCCMKTLVFSRNASLVEKGHPRHQAGALLWYAESCARAIWLSNRTSALPGSSPSDRYRVAVGRVVIRPASDRSAIALQRHLRTPPHRRGRL